MEALKTQKLFDVKTYDIDIAGHLNNAVYIKWLEDLRNQFLDEAIDYPKFIEDGFYAVVISTSIKYKEEIRFNEKPFGIIRLRGYIDGVMDFVFEFVVRDCIVAKAEQKCVVMNLKESKMVINYALKNRVELQEELPLAEI